jgi:hypothetical protein
VYECRRILRRAKSTNTIILAARILRCGVLARYTSSPVFAQPSNLNILSLRIERWMLMVFARRVLAFGALLASLWCVEVAVLPVILVELSSGASVYHGVVPAAGLLPHRQ